MKLVRLGAPARRLLQLPLLAQARRWKNRFASDQVSELMTQIAEIPAVFERLAQEYEQAPKD
jgi:V/A-type H+/Na+-transporting ATPase subunit A